MIQSSGQCRPISYSESHAHNPIIQGMLEPLLVPSTQIIETRPQVQKDYIKTIHAYAVRFSLHLTLISLFETVFFWHFVSQSENTALISLVNNYAQGVLDGCAGMPESQRALIRNIFDLFINQTIVDASSAISLASRNAYNSILIRNSWIYVGSLAAIFFSTITVGICKRFPIEWRTILLENLAMVSCLGIYEWMFFSTVVLQYQAISIQELDSMVVDAIQVQC